MAVNARDLIPEALVRTIAAADPEFSPYEGNEDYWWQFAENLLNEDVLNQSNLNKVVWVPKEKS